MPKDRIHHNLSPEPPYFLGYDDLLKQVCQEILKRSQTIILKGFGGTGKSTIANKVAHHFLLQDIFQAIVWVDIRQYGSERPVELNSILDLIARVCHFDAEINQMSAEDEKAQKIVQMLSEQAVLLIFDNFESLLHQPQATKVIDFISRLPMSSYTQSSARSGLTRVLMTTREIAPDLEILKPCIYPITGLDLESTNCLVEKRLRDLSSVRCLSEKNRILLHRLTGGIPKLIEIVVGQIPFLSFEQVIQNLDIHKNIEASDDIYFGLFRRIWTNILTLPQKHTLLATTFFVEHAPFSAIAATAGLNHGTCSQSIVQLFNLSLLELDNSGDEPVYRTHPLTQAICEVYLKDFCEFEAMAAQRFVDYYFEFSKKNYQGEPQIMKTEAQNIMMAINQAMRLFDWQKLIDIRVPINSFLWYSGYWRERVQVNINILEASRRLGNRSLEAKILVEDLGFTYLRFENLPQAELYIRQGLSIYQELNEESGIALATRHLGKSALLKGEYALYEPGEKYQHFFKEAEQLYTISLKLRQQLSAENQEQELAIGDLKLDLGRLYWLWGRKSERAGRQPGKPVKIKKAFRLYQQGIQTSQDAITIFDSYHNDRGRSKGLGNLGNIYKQIGLCYLADSLPEEALQQLNQAITYYQESLEIAQRINKTDEIAHANWGLAESYEIMADLMNDQNIRLQAIKAARASNQLYSLMATPEDKRVTEELINRIHSKLNAFEHQKENAQGREKKMVEKKADFVIITALEEERDAVINKIKRMPNYRRLPPSSDTIRNYYQADLPVTFSDGTTGFYKVAVLSLLGMGRVQAAAATAEAIRDWNPRHVVLVGIAGGVAARGVRPGDILCADQIVDYELQKLNQTGPQIRWEVYRSDARLLDAFKNYTQTNWHNILKVKRPDSSKPKFHIGPIASGDKVIAFSEILSKYREIWTKLIGVEMEAAGVAAVAFQSTKQIGFFMLRGVSDLADEEKGTPEVEKWRAYACDVAASLAISFLKSGPIPLETSE